MIALVVLTTVVGCVLAIVLVALLAVWADAKNTDPTFALFGILCAAAFVFLMTVCARRYLEQEQAKDAVLAPTVPVLPTPAEKPERR